MGRGRDRVGKESRPRGAEVSRRGRGVSDQGQGRRALQWAPSSTLPSQPAVTYGCPRPPRRCRFGENATPHGVSPAVFSEAQEHLAHVLADRYSVSMSQEQIQAAIAASKAAYDKARDAERAEVPAAHNRSTGPWLLPFHDGLLLLFVNKLHSDRLGAAWMWCALMGCALMVWWIGGL